METLYVIIHKEYKWLFRDHYFLTREDAITFLKDLVDRGVTWNKFEDYSIKSLSLNPASR